MPRPPGWRRAARARGGAHRGWRGPAGRTAPPRRPRRRWSPTAVGMRDRLGGRRSWLGFPAGDRPPPPGAGELGEVDAVARAAEVGLVVTRGLLVGDDQPAPRAGQRPGGHGGELALLAGDRLPGPVHPQPGERPQRRPRGRLPTGGRHTRWPRRLLTGVPR